ncbi:hypothetical protein PIB30_115466, partial [Stylosanthes scabra]|nr:hypothetical protein [Stylosanthes scabra]
LAGHPCAHRDQFLRFVHGHENHHLTYQQSQYLGRTAHPLDQDQADLPTHDQSVSESISGSSSCFRAN